LQGKLFTSIFLQAAVASPILGMDFLRKIKVTVSPEINQIQFACSAVAPACQFFAFRGPACPPNIFSGLVHLAFFIELETSPGSGSNSATHCNNFFIASCHICISSLESRGEVVQL
jgi:hypothetical protein